MRIHEQVPEKNVLMYWGKIAVIIKVVREITYGKRSLK